LAVVVFIMSTGLLFDLGAGIDTRRLLRKTGWLAFSISL